MMKTKNLLLVLITVIAIGIKSGAQTSVAYLTNSDIVATLSEVSKQKVTFNNNNLKMAGNLYLPKGFDKNKKYPAIVVVHPGGGVKEQTAGLYAENLAASGFITLAFDASHQGESGGEPRLLDNPMNRVGDIYSAVDYLVTLSYIDGNRIGAIGICAGSGATVKAAMTERRIKALATVSAVDVGAAGRKGWDGKGSINQIETLEAVAKQRTAEANGAAPLYVPYVPEVGDKTAPLDLQEAAEYYRTSRGQHPNSTNKMLFTGAGYAILFDGFGQADKLLTQPLLLVAGSEAGSLWHSEELIAKAGSKDKELFIIKGATHMDLYDGKQYFPQVTKKLTEFFGKNL